MSDKQPSLTKIQFHYDDGSIEETEVKEPIPYISLLDKLNGQSMINMGELEWKTVFNPQVDYRNNPDYEMTNNYVHVEENAQFYDDLSQLVETMNYFRRNILEYTLIPPKRVEGVFDMSLPPVEQIDHIIKGLENAIERGYYIALPKNRPPVREAKEQIDKIEKVDGIVRAVECIAFDTYMLKDLSLARQNLKTALLDLL